MGKLKIDQERHMTGDENVDAGTMAAVSVVNAETTREQNKLEEQRQRELLIAQSHEMAGQIKAAAMFSKFGDVSRLVWLRQVKETKAYKGIGSWEIYCEYLGLDRRTIDEDLQNLNAFGQDFLETVAKMSVGYRELRKLRQIAGNGDVIVSNESITIGDEVIPIDPDHTEDLQVAIESLLERKEKEAEEAKMAIAVKERQLGLKNDQIRKMEKAMAKLEVKAKLRGYTAQEEAFIKRMEAARTTIDGFMMDFDPDIKGVIPDDATPRMLAAYMTTLGYLRRVVTGMFDSASDTYGDADMDDDWVPPHLRPDYTPDNRPDDGPDCRTCEHHKGMMNPAKGVKIPGGTGKCTRPEGPCKEADTTSPEA